MAAVPSDDIDLRHSPIHGSGVFAHRAFQRGDRVLPIDDSRVVGAEHPLDPERGEFDHHQDYLGDRNILMRKPERYINHCCEPNTFVKTLDGVRWVVAYRDIAANEEITYDYCINSYGDDEWGCSCGHPNCRRVHNTDFFKLPEEKLVEYLPLLDDWFGEWKGDAVSELRKRFADRIAEAS